MKLSEKIRNLLKVILCIPIFVGLICLMEGFKLAMSEPERLTSWTLLMCTVIGYPLYILLLLPLAKRLNQENCQSGQILRMSSGEFTKLIQHEGKLQQYKETRNQYRKLNIALLIADGIAMAVFLGLCVYMVINPGTISYWWLLPPGIVWVIFWFLMLYFYFILPEITYRAACRRRRMESVDINTKSSATAADNEEILELARANPPQCLSGFILKQESPLLPQLKITDTEIAYQLECSCGGTHFKFHGFRYPERERNGNICILAPITVTCSLCGHEAPVFDDDKDGYDAMIDFRSERSDPHEPWTLDGEYQLAVSFEYSMTDDEIPDFPELTNGHGGDYFTWITIYGQKDGEEPQNLFDWECA